MLAMGGTTQLDLQLLGLQLSQQDHLGENQRYHRPRRPAPAVGEHLWDRNYDQTNDCSLAQWT